MAWQILPERPDDALSIAAVHRAAFPTDAEARLVDALRAAGRLVVSRVAVTDDGIVGHVAFSPVTIDGRECGGVGLAPLAVLPAYQRRGIGGDLVRAGIEACRDLGVRFVVVLGWPDYYPRFGFDRADVHGLANEYTQGPSFMVLPLSGGLPASGLVRYAPEFAMFG
jgi:putative acetyltransferase